MTLAVIGGGAAGFFCAVNAAGMDPSLRVIIIERSGKLLSKVKISGGGRCNVTHACFDINEMSERYPRGYRFVKKAFHQFFTTDTIQWFEERGVRLKTEEDGRMFPVTDSSQTIIDCLLREASKFGVEIMMNAEVKEIKHEPGKFLLTMGKTGTANAQLSEGLFELTADCICLATGGYPKSQMFNWITKLGHSIEDPVPSLFTFNLPDHPITKLMGISVEDVIIKLEGMKLEQRGALLITHWGLSGPAVLKLSARAARQLAMDSWQFAIRINWLGETKEPELRIRIQALRDSQGSKKISGKNEFGLPARLWEFLIAGAGIGENTRWADLSSAMQNLLIRQLTNYSCAVKGKTTFKEEFVTAGGIKLNEIDHQTMMSRIIPDLYFAGEVMDVDAITGGYNFQHAWTSGFIAAKAIAKRKN